MVTQHYLKRHSGARTVVRWTHQYSPVGVICQDHSLAKVTGDAWLSAGGRKNVKSHVRSACRQGAVIFTQLKVRKSRTNCD